MELYQMERAINQARDTLKTADAVTRSMARIIQGRLQRADIEPGVLRALKRELQDFNMTTGKWKQQ